ncbi:V-type ATP synthase subunit I [Halochromatium salexigens]|uniref:ATPase n=1 Tax=Halochromatium salexigens TaxID=49447 RepID=A0AAJ0XEW0_HALSE|nr:V-type ATPase 116kDa subunit family protein [Halochromatium salexigens]MBK5929593.1 ATPase [Halochromatium salexigens]
MKHVRVLVITDDLPQASLTLAETESFHPDTRPPEEQLLSGLPGRDYREIYQQAHARLEKIAKVVPVDEEPDLGEVRVIEHDELRRINEELTERWAEASRFEEGLRRIDEQDRFVREQQASLENFSNLKIDLGALRNKTRFLDFYVGVVPRENVSRLQGAVTLADHLLFTYLERDQSTHVVIVGPRGEKESQLASVLSSASFQPLPIPAGLADTSPEHKYDELTAERNRLQAEREALNAEVEAWGQAHRDLLRSTRRSLMLAAPFVTLDPSIRSAGHLAVVCGWVPARAVEDLEARLGVSLALPFELESRDPRPAERPLVPTVPSANRLLAPFAMLVKQYGIPQYGEVDPTPLFAVTFLLMFGSMFGDIGQGAVIAGVAWALRAKLGRFYRFGVMAGLSSMVFGVLYGSIFGYEEILPALWMSPIHHPILMLKIALGYGVLFIAIACGLAIYNRIAVKDLKAAVFGHHGLINLVFYLALIWGAVGIATRSSFGTAPLLLVIGALMALAGYAWSHLQAPTGEKILVVFIETLETVIGYISNTLSFLRVAAFSLNHAALSLAVLTLAAMMGPAGHVITVILGNVFVLVLEGGIVMIQVMRLQYYEGFSRYFSGDGHEFSPLKLRRGPV